LNPTKISGTCGRLMCCLKYEQDAYEDLIRTSPKAESFVDTPDGRGTVVDIDLLRQRVKVKMEQQPEVIGTYANESIAILRNGKAKKTDPPIPADLAPISGGGTGRRFHKDLSEEAPVLESIKFRYSEETIAEEQSPASPTESAKENNRSRNRNRRHKKPSQNNAPKQDASQKKAAPAKEESAPQKKNHHHRRRHKKPAKPQE